MNSPLLEPEQKTLLFSLVEAARSVPREQRTPFFVLRTLAYSVQEPLIGPGVPEGTLVVPADIEILASCGLLHRHHNPRAFQFSISPVGFAYYEASAREGADRVGRLESTTRRFLSDQSFRRSFPSAFAKWSSAEELLWSSDSQAQLTVIGHWCREALQDFALRLSELTGTATDLPPSSTIARIRPILSSRAAPHRDFLNALVAYWGELSDLVQRQEHGALKEGEELVWEDARRIVFHTAIVMLELHRFVALRASGP